MDFVEAEGDTIDAAIDHALELLGVGREKITIDIISEGRKGILGFGAQKAKIRAALRKSRSVLTRPSEAPPAVIELSNRPRRYHRCRRKSQSRPGRDPQADGIRRHSGAKSGPEPRRNDS